MVRTKINEQVEGIVLGLLKTKRTYRDIIKVVKELGFNISLGTIHNIRHKNGLQRNLSSNTSSTRKFKKRPSVSTPTVVRKISSMISRVNPPTQREMALKLKVSVGTVNRVIKQVICAKLRKKCKVHQLNATQILKRRQRSWRLYQKLCAGKWKHFVTSDEAMFYLGGSYGRRKVCYVRKGAVAGDNLKFVKRDAFAAGFMAWAAVCFNGKTAIRIIDKGTKVNADFYIRNVLRPFLDKDVPRLFPGDTKRHMVFHQDSASSHTAKATLNYLKSRGIKFITPEEWMPKSPDAAPMDYGIWGVLKRKLQKRTINSLRGLKKALKQEWAKLDQNLIIKTLQSWPKRCRMIYYCHGSHIEHLLQ